MKKLFVGLCWILFFGSLWGCAAASKDVYFKTRLPTMENLEIDAENKFGLDVDFENRRFEVTATNNLVNNFQFTKDRAALSDGPLFQIRGLDAAVTYAHSVRKILPFQLAVAFDYAEIKMAVFDQRPSGGAGWKGIVNFGLYKSTAFEATSDKSCFIYIFCFSSNADRTAAKNKEEEITTSYGGVEQKVGTSIGYYFDDKKALFVGYNWYQADIFASAHRDTPFSDIDFRQSFYGSGVGLGFSYRSSQHYVAVFKLEQVSMDWNSQRYSNIVAGFSNHFTF